ncbi:NOP58 family protein [Candidatus Woesearchaeota archaeon]|nr:NOP58 family protein [Candidatus Woesearchaeota archaeon]
MAGYIYTTSEAQFLIDEGMKNAKRIGDGLSDEEMLEKAQGKITDREQESCKQNSARLLYAINNAIAENDLQKIRRAMLLVHADPGNREKAIRTVKMQVSNSVNDDNLIIQTTSSIEELDKSINTHAKRLREWFSLHVPEIDRSIQDHEQYADEILGCKGKKRDDVLKARSIEITMGRDLPPEDLEEIYSLAEHTKGLFRLRKKHMEYLDNVEERYCPHMKKIGGTMIVAKLLCIAKSLKKLAEVPSSTIQILGAEKALFRHLKTKAKPPKYGVLYSHPEVQKAKRDQRGKTARKLASKLSIAAKQDYFGKK